MPPSAPFTEAITHVLEAYRAAKVHAADTLADLLTPGVLVVPAGIEDNRLDASVVNVELTLYLVAAGYDSHAVASLDQLLATGRQLGLVGPTAHAVSLTAPNHNAGGLPALETTINLEVS